MNRIAALWAVCCLAVAVAGAAPANDNLAQAIELPAVPPVVEGTTVGATQEAGEINGGYWPYHSVWYKWTPAESGGWEIGFINPELVSIIVTRGTTFQNFQQVGFADSSFPNSFWVDAGETYYFQVQAGQREGSPFSFRFTRGPANDAFAGRAQLPASGTFQVSMIGAAVETGEPDYGPMQGRTLWWDWTPARSGSHVISSLGGFEYHPLFNVYQGTSLAGLTALATERVSTMEGLKTVVRVNAGERYVLRLVATSPERGLVTFTIQPGLLNDEWENALPIGALNAVVRGDTTSATYQPGEVSPQTRGGGTLWYWWEAPASGSYVARSASEIGIAKVFVYFGDGVSRLTSLEQAAQPYSPGGESLFPFRAAAGQRLWVAVDAMDSVRGPFTLGILAPATNDDFAAAERLEGTQAASAWRPFIGTVEPGEPEYAGIGNAGSLWWRWVAPRTGSFLVTSEHETSKRVGLGVYTGASLETLTRVTGGTNWSHLVFAGFWAEEGREYRIHVAHNPGSWAPTRLSIETGPWNDAFADAETISSAPAQGGVQWRIPTLEPNEPMNFPSKGTLWWKWTAPAAGSYSFSARSLSADVAAFSGATRDALQLVGRGVRGEWETVLAFRAAQGETFHFVIALPPNLEPTDAYLPWALEVGPPNDHFGDATALGALPQLIRSTTRGATAEAGEPLHTFTGATASVWFKWVAPFTGRVMAGTDGIAGRIYTGTALENLQALPGGELSGNARWIDVAEGAQYYFALATAPANAGAFSFRLGLPPANGSYAARETIEEIGVTHRSWTMFTGSGGAVWWNWTAPEDGILTVQTTPVAPASQTLIYYDEPWIGGGGIPASLTNRVAVEAGRKYDIAVSTTAESPDVSVTLQFRPEASRWSEDNFLRGGTSHWFEETAEFHTGPTAMQAGPLARGETSWIQRTFVGSGRLSFWWKQTSERLTFDIVRLPGQTRYFSPLQAQSVWTRVEAPLNYGTNVARWTAARASYFPAEAITVPVFVDDVAFTPDAIQLLEPRWTASGLEVGLRADVARAVTTWHFESSSDLRTWSGWATRQVDSRAMEGPYEVRATYAPPTGQRMRFFRVRR